MPSLPASSLPVSSLNSLAAQPPPHVPIAPASSKVHAIPLTPFSSQSRMRKTLVLGEAICSQKVVCFDL